MYGGEQPEITLPYWKGEIWSNEMFFDIKKPAYKDFLFVEKVSYHNTELVSGNYTDGHVCVDWPWYWINEENETLSAWMNLSNETRLIYGFGTHFNGLMQSGGSNDLEVVETLPTSFITRVKVEGNNFNVTILIDENDQVLLNGTELLLPGESVRYSYDYKNEYINHVDGESCTVRYFGYTQIMNFGYWSKSNYIRYEL